MKIKIPFITFLTIISIGCQENKNPENKDKKVRNAIETLQNDKYLIDSSSIKKDKNQGLWHVFKIEKAKNFKQEIAENEANDFGKTIIIRIANDSLYVNNLCSYKIYSYHYSIKNIHHYGTESVFAPRFPQKDSIKIITNYDGSNKGCQEPYYPIVLVDNELILFNAGYFFFLKREGELQTFNTVIKLPFSSKDLLSGKIKFSQLEHKIEGLEGYYCGENPNYIQLL